MIPARRQQKRTSETCQLCKRAQRHAGGFTLVELLVVLVVLGLLIGIVGPRAVGYLSGARADTARIQLETFITALELYRLDMGRYPSSDEGLSALVSAPQSVAKRWRGPYLSKRTVPLDPWDNPYVYRSPSPDGGPFQLASLGADMREGGEGDDADIIAP